MSPLTPLRLSYLRAIAEGCETTAGLAVRFKCSAKNAYQTVALLEARGLVQRVGGGARRKGPIQATDAGLFVVEQAAAHEVAP